MAEIGQVSGKGKRKGSEASGVGRAGKTAGLAELAESAEFNTAKPRKRRVKGYGVDRLRTAAERRMAESSEALAETLMDNALKGKLESVKILMKLAEEEKARKEEEREGGEPTLCDILLPAGPEVGPMWDRRRKKAAAIRELWDRRRAEKAEREKRRWDDLEEAA
jgi:hypothetical protein